MSYLTTTAVLIAVLALFTAIPSFHSKRRLSAGDYENQTAAAKQQYLWDSILSSGDQPGTWYNVLQLLELFTESDVPTGATVSDFFPDKRKKLIHTVGAIAMCEFTFDHDYGYTGLFNATLGGSHFSLCRASSATQPSATSLTPGFSFKLLRDNVPSANFFAMWQLDGQKELNFFKNVLVNHVADRPDLPLQIKALKIKFSSVSRWPGLVGLSDMASFDQSGISVEGTPKFPFALVFQPNPEIQEKFASITSFDIPTYFPQSFIGNETLYKIYAVPDVSDTPTLLPIGTVKLTSPFIASKFADASLFFRHIFIEHDFKLRPDWQSTFADKTKNRPSYEGAILYQKYLPPYNNDQKDEIAEY